VENSFRSLFYKYIFNNLLVLVVGAVDKWISAKTLDFTAFLGYSRIKVEESGAKSHKSGAKWWIS
jgi:hypothetical protein